MWLIVIVVKYFSVSSVRIYELLLLLLFFVSSIKSESIVLVTCLLLSSFPSKLYFISHRSYRSSVLLYYIHLSVVVKYLCALFKLCGIPMPLANAALVPCHWRMHNNWAQNYSRNLYSECNWIECSVFTWGNVSNFVFAFNWNSFKTTFPFTEIVNHLNDPSKFENLTETEKNKDPNDNGTHAVFGLKSFP